MYPAVKAAGDAKGFHLETGKGNDPDTFGKHELRNWSMSDDSDKFPIPSSRGLYAIQG
jgi:hypothetical protein